MTARLDCAVDVPEKWTEPARYALEELLRGLGIEPRGRQEITARVRDHRGRFPYEASQQAVLAAARDVGGLAVMSRSGDAFASFDAAGPDADAEYGEVFHRLARRVVEEGAALRSVEQARIWYWAGRLERISPAAHE